MCVCVCVFFFFKQKTAYESGTGDWSSDVCSSDLKSVLALLLSRMFVWLCLVFECRKTIDRLSKALQSESKKPLAFEFELIGMFAWCAVILDRKAAPFCNSF